MPSWPALETRHPNYHCLVFSASGYLRGQVWEGCSSEMIEKTRVEPEMKVEMVAKRKYLNPERTTERKYEE